MFTPPSVRGEDPDDTQGTIQLPGWVGGADWNGAAIDPETQILYVPSITAPIVAALVEPDAEAAIAGRDSEMDAALALLHAPTEAGQ